MDSHVPKDLTPGSQAVRPLPHSHAPISNLDFSRRILGAACGRNCSRKRLTGADCSRLAHLGGKYRCRFIFGLGLLLLTLSSVSCKLIASLWWKYGQPESAGFCSPGFKMRERACGSLLDWKSWSRLRIPGHLPKTAEGWHWPVHLESGSFPPGARALSAAGWGPGEDSGDMVIRNGMNGCWDCE